MIYKGIEVVCPACRADLDASATESWRCHTCGARYPVVAGIPDLRRWPDPYIGPEDDRAKGRAVAEAATTRGFEALIDHYYSMTSVVPPADAAMYKRGLLAAGPRAQASLARWRQEAGGVGQGGAFLDVGCGTGPLLVAAARAGYGPVVGVDVAFRWLVLGRARLQEAGLDLPLLCANAEALPFKEERFDVVALDSVIEHCRDQAATVADAHRVLRAGGTCFLSTPNRFSVGPDPHTGLPLGSLLPAAWTARYARAKGAIPPVRHLLSRRTLTRLLRDARFSEPRLFLPGFSAEQRAHFKGAVGAAIGAYEVVRRTPGLKSLLFTVGPLLSAVARKPAAEGRP
ncbi:MAG: methyltransferase domain-containing protein [Gemmatimonadota bacterium]